jgi:hypothetical protein
MSRRPSLPGAAELFRVTGGPATASAPAPAQKPAPEREKSATPIREVPRHEVLPPATIPPSTGPVLHSAPLSEPPYDNDVEGGELTVAQPPQRRQVAPRRRMRAVGDRRPSGRERHDEKITVYCSAEELVDLEHARLQLRAEHGIAIDRGRIVREAVAVVIADLEAKGESSILVRRLREG